MGLHVLESCSEPTFWSHIVIDIDGLPIFRVCVSETGGLGARLVLLHGSSTYVQASDEFSAS
jgi:hypothetical protein